MKPIKLTQSVKQSLRENLFRDLNKTLDDLKMSDTSFKFTYDLKDVMKVDPQTVKKPIVYMLGNTYLKMLQYVLLSDNEIAWRGTVERKEHIFFIKDVFLYPQKVTGATVQEDPDEGQKWSDALPTEVYNTMRFQGHSHVNMGAFWSGTDKADQNAHLQELLDDDYYIFAVMNKKQDILVEVYDLAQNVIFEKEDVTFKVFLDKKTLISSLKDEIEKYIKKPATYTYQSNNIGFGANTYHGMYGRDNWNNAYGQTQGDSYYGRGVGDYNFATTSTKKSTNGPAKVKRHVVIDNRIGKTFMKEYPEYEGNNMIVRFNGEDYWVFVPYNPFDNGKIRELRKEGWKVREMPVPEDAIL